MKIKQWPLPEGARAELVAAGSPDGTGIGKQWRLPAYFVSESGDSFALRVSWGLLPKLRPGTVFVDGFLFAQRNDVDTLYFEIDSPLRFETWAEATKGQDGWFRIEALQDEVCVAFEGDGRKIVVPCIQVLRAFHAQTRLIAHAALRPGTMSEIVTGNIEGDRATIYISRMVPARMVTQAFSRYLARLLFQTEWASSFNDVFHDRFARVDPAGDLRARVSLQCMPPVAGKSTWNVSGQSLENGAFFVSDLSFTRSTVRAPFDSLVVVHSKGRGSAKSAGEGITVDAEDSGEQLRRGGEKEGPGKLSRPAFVRHRPINHHQDNEPRIADIFPSGVRENPWGSGGANRSAALPSDATTTSFDDERRSGSLQGGEFLIVPGRDSLPIHFKVFINAFERAIQDRPGWTIEFKLEELADHVDECDPADRLVLFARVEASKTVGYLIELEPLQGQASYTLTAVRNKEPTKASIAELGIRLRSWLTTGGRSHVQSLLKKDEQYEISLSTHRDLGAAVWTSRILEKICPRDRRPAWTRGVAS